MSQTEIDALNDKLTQIGSRRSSISGRINMLEDEIVEAREALDVLDEELHDTVTEAQMKVKIGNIELTSHLDNVGRMYVYKGNGRWVPLLYIHFVSNKAIHSPHIGIRKFFEQKEDTVNSVKGMPNS